MNDVHTYSLFVETILAEEASHKQTAKLRKKTQKQEDEKKKIKIEVLG